MLESFEMDAAGIGRCFGLLLEQLHFGSNPNQIEVRIRRPWDDLLECCDEICNALSMVHSAYSNDGGMFDGSGRRGIERWQTRTQERGIKNNMYLGFRNAHFLHTLADCPAANDDTIGKTHHGRYALMDVLDVSNQGVMCESRDQPCKQQASARMNVNNVWLKNAEIPMKCNHSFHQLQRPSPLVEWEMLNIESA